MLAVPATAADRIDRLPTNVLVKEGKKITGKQTFSVRHGGCSRYAQRIAYELVERAFRPYGTVSWALYIVRRESGFCAGAVNTTYNSWREQAQCLAQMIPKYHTWINYKRCKSDPAYSVAVFLRLSRGGHSTGPWSTY